MKRIFDILVAFIALVLAVPVIIFCAALIGVTSEGSPLFSQKRIGWKGIPFSCYKLRTMVIGTKQAGTHDVSVDSIIPIGRFLRHWKIDELPQLWNVLRGEMSLVGPRPCLPVQEKLIEARKKRGVYLIRPGITGLAQIEGIDMSDPEKLAKKDADYVVRRCMALDVKLIILTFLVGR